GSDSIPDMSPADGLDGLAAFFAPAVGSARARSIRSASDDVAGPSPRATSIASRAAPSDGNGPRTSGSPNSLVWLVSTITHVPDCGSIWKRPSLVSQRPPPRRRSGSGFASDVAMAQVSPQR